MRGVSFDKYTIQRLEEFREKKRDTTIILINRALNTLENIRTMQENKQTDKTRC